MAVATRAADRSGPLLPTSSTTTASRPDLDPGALLEALAEAGFELGAPEPVRRTALDTFDGRLRAAGLRLELRTARGTELVLTGGGSPPAHLATTGAPRFAVDLPRGPFRARLAPVLDVRALLPLVTLRSTRTVAVRRDDDGGAVVVVAVHTDLEVEGHGPLTPPWVAEVEQLEGYAKAARRASEVLDPLGVHQSEDALDLAASAAGVDPAGYDPSPTVPLDRHVPALDGFRAVLLHLADTIDANWEGAVDDVDPEFLHDLRVAVRRTRSVLAEAKGVLPKEVRATYRAAFKWMGDTTSPPRDLDVHVLEWDGYLAPLPAGAANALAPVLDHLSKRRQAAHADLARALRSGRARDLRTGWRTWLEDPPAGQRPGGHADDPVGEVVAARIASAQAALLAAGRAIDETSPAEDLHELRKDAKKLRYLLECFGGLLDKDLRKAFVARLKALQDNLGEHQDAEVHVGELEAVARAIAGDVDPGTLIALGQLTGHLEQRRLAARSEFGTRFADYDTKATARTLDALLASASGAVG